MLAALGVYIAAFEVGALLAHVHDAPRPLPVISGVEVDRQLAHLADIVGVEVMDRGAVIAYVARIVKAAHEMCVLPYLLEATGYGTTARTILVLVGHAEVAVVVGREVYTHLSRSALGAVDDGSCLLDENLLRPVDGVGEVVVLACGSCVSPEFAEDLGLALAVGRREIL